MSRTQEATVAGLTIIAVKPGEAKPNSWNPNEMDEATFEKELASIVENGFMDPIVVREIEDGTLQIVDGEHRDRAAQKLGIELIPAIFKGEWTEHAAKKWTIIGNELRGRPQADKLAVLVADLGTVQPLEELATVLPYTEVEMAALVKTTESYDWANARVPVAEEKNSNVSTGAEHRRVSIGRIAGTVPSWLVNELVKEFDRTAVARGSTSVEAVFADWARRLKETEPEGNKRAQVAVADPPASRKTRGKKKDV